jgi:hypothetical protein
VYRGAILASSLCMALTLLSWRMWVWKAFAYDGWWKQAPRVIKPGAAGPLPPSGA